MRHNITVSNLTMNTNKQNRYPGVSFFETKDEHIFFGRDEDAERLNRLVMGEKTVVLYARSGIGKSSLINAALIPAVNKLTNFQRYEMRFHAFDQSNYCAPVDRMLQKLPTLQTSTFLDKILPNDNSQWRYFKTMQITAADSDATILLIFDQFEEIFSYPESDLNEFKRQLADVLYNPVPVDFKNALRRLQRDKPDILTDDEETILYRQPKIKALFSMRRDYYSMMNRLADKLTGITRMYYELQALDEEQMRLAITQPAALTGNFETQPFVYEEAAIQKIMNYLTQGKSETAETTQLQIICRHCEQRIAQKAAAGETKLVITTADIPQFENIFRQFYNDCINRLPEKYRAETKRFIEDQLVKNNQRIPVAEKACDAHLLQPLHLLTDMHLLRREEFSATQALYELSHDTMVEPVARAKAERDEEDRKAEEIRKRNEELRIAKERAKRQRRNTLIAAGLAVLFLAIGIFGLWQMFAAKKALKTADENLKAFVTAEVKRKKLIAKNMIDLGQDSIAIKYLREAKKLDPENLEIDSLIGVRGK